VVAVEAIKQPDSTYLAYTDNGREYTGVDVISWVKEAENRGAGEILLTSIDQEGTGNGFDYKLIKIVSDIVKIPIIAHGGAANETHIAEAINSSGADAVAVASMLHYAALNRNGGLVGKYDEEGNTEFLKKSSSFKMFGEENLSEIKNSLNKRNIPLRILN
jgi:cyclase